MNKTNTYTAINMIYNLVEAFTGSKINLQENTTMTNTTNTIITNIADEEITDIMDNCDLSEEEAIDFINRNNEYTELKQALKQELINNGYDEYSAENIADEQAYSSAFYD